MRGGDEQQLGARAIAEQCEQIEQTVIMEAQTIKQGMRYCFSTFFGLRQTLQISLILDNNIFFGVVVILDDDF